MDEDIDLVIQNYDLIMRNKDKILGDEYLSSVKVGGTGCVLPDRRQICFTLSNLIRLWSNITSWKFGRFLTYKIVLYGNSQADIFSQTPSGDFETSLIDEDIITPMVVDMVSVGKVIMFPKDVNDVIFGLKGKI